MRSKALIALGALLFAASLPTIAHAQPTLYGVSQVRGPVAGKYRIEARFSGDPLAAATMGDPGSWLVIASPKTGAAIDVPLANVSWSAATKTARLTFLLPGGAPSDFGWKVVFKAENLFQVAAPATVKAGYDAADDKDGSDTYLSGSFLAGQNSKPIYAADAKLDLTWEVDEGPWDRGFTASASVNQEAKPPVDHTPLSFDAITLGTALRYTGATRPIIVDIQPFGGSYSSDTKLGELTANTRIGFIFPPWNHATLYPFVGVEGAYAVMKPDSMFDQPVNLSNLSWIGRIIGGAAAGYSIFRPNAKASDLYLFRFEAKYTARKPFTDEPFVKKEPVAGKLTNIVRLNRDVRHEATASVLLPFTPFVGVKVEYRYGSQPPAFERVDGVVSVSLAFKAKLAEGRPALF